MKEKIVMDSRQFNRKVLKLSSEILDDAGGAENLVLVGIRSTGEHFSKRIAAQISRLSSTDIPVGLLDITLYRDDFFNRPVHPEIKKTILDFDINNKHVVLVDDVIWTGRTVRAALDHLIDFGRPAKVRLSVLIDRGGRELPIQPDFSGKSLSLKKDAWISLEMNRKKGQKDRVIITERKDSPEKKAP